METGSNRLQRAERRLRAAYQRQMSGDLKAAVNLYQASIAEHPTAEAHTYLGWTYSYLGRYEDAIAECKTAIRVDPEFGNPYNDIGSYLVHQGQLEEAIPWLEKAKEAKRYEPRHYPYLNLGKVYLKLGKIHEATREFEQASFLQDSLEEEESAAPEEETEITLH